MDRAFVCILLLLCSLYATLGKYVYITTRKTWPDAQAYCEDQYTDLAPVSNQEDTAELQRLATNASASIWIGLERSFTNANTWMWSGGGEVSKFFWAPGQPDNQEGKNVGFIYNYMWNASSPDQTLPFFCYQAVAVEETMAWEEALRYCWEKHHNLASMASDTEMLLIQKELARTNTTEHVWMGLRFLPDRWLWADGTALNYEAWGNGGKPACPDAKLKCGALTLGAQSGSAIFSWQNQSVKHQEKRAADTQLRASATTGPAGAIQMVWEAYDCQEKLSFVCY